MSEWEGDLARSRDMCTLIPEPRGAGLIIQRLHSPAWGAAWRREARGEGAVIVADGAGSASGRGSVQPPTVD